MLNKVLMTAGVDCVEVFVLNHTTFKVILESLPFSAVHHDGLATNPITFIFFSLGEMIGHWSYLPRLARDTSQMRYASK